MSEVQLNFLKSYVREDEISSFIKEVIKKPKWIMIQIINNVLSKMELTSK